MKNNHKSSHIKSTTHLIKNIDLRKILTSLLDNIYLMNQTFTK